MSGYFGVEQSLISFKEKYIENFKIKKKYAIFNYLNKRYKFKIHFFQNTNINCKSDNLYVVDDEKILYGDNYCDNNYFLEYHACVFNHLHVLKWITKTSICECDIVDGFVKCIKLGHYDIINYLIKEYNIVKICFYYRNIEHLKPLKYKRKNTYFKGYKKN